MTANTALRRGAIAGGPAMCFLLALAVMAETPATSFSSSADLSTGNIMPEHYAGRQTSGLQARDVVQAEETGACCNLGNGNCATSDTKTCYASGGVFLGVGTNCATVFCCSEDIACSFANAYESEPASNCVTGANHSDPDRDRFNAGCYRDGSGFSTIRIGDRVCGKTSQYQGVPDVDWYVITIDTTESFLGLQLSGIAVNMELALFAKAVGTDCPGDLIAERLASRGLWTCDPGVIAVTAGECVTAGTYFVRVRPAPSAGDVPCEAQYTLSALNGECLGPPVACPTDARLELEPDCHLSGINQGCDAPSPNPGTFTEVPCTSVVCGTVDAQDGVRDADWYVVRHIGGPLRILLTNQFYASLRVFRVGNQGPEGCSSLDDWGSELFKPPTSGYFGFVSPYTDPGTFYVVVAPSADGPSRVLCGASYKLQIDCALPCPCTANISDSFGDECAVNNVDLTWLLLGFGQACTGRDTSQPFGSPARCPAGFVRGDLNLDGIVDTADLTILLLQYGRSNVHGVCK